MKKIWFGLGKLIGFVVIGSLILTIISPLIILEFKVISIFWKLIF